MVYMILYGISLVRFFFYFCVFRGRCLWIFWGQVFVFGPCRYGIWVFCICFSTKIFSYLFFRFFSGSLSCCLFATYFEFLGPHGPGFFHTLPVWIFGPPEPELALEPWRELALAATPISMAAWLPVEDSGRLSLVAPEDTCVLIRPTASASPGEVGLSA